MLLFNDSNLNQSELANIVAKASFLSERLNSETLQVYDTPVNPQKLGEQRLNQWCQIVAQGNWEKFKKRLHWDKLDVDSALKALEDSPVIENQILPKWAITLQEIIQTTLQWSKQQGKQFDNLATKNTRSLITNSEETLPFEDLLLPMCLVARQKLLTRLGSLPLDLLCEEAYFMLERSLLISLVHLCENTLEWEFTHFRPLGERLLNLIIKDTNTTQKKGYYQAFVHKLSQDGLLSFFHKYSVLARLIATRIDFWVEAVVEFLQRLQTDYSELQQLFAPATNVDRQSVFSQAMLGKVIEIKANLSDSHNQGRGVFALKFESGLKIIYKPKNLGLEVAYNEFLAWCNQQDVPLPFLILKILNRNTYGWVEYVEPQPCEDDAAAKRFYQRAGMLLCLLYALNGNDCHFENLIASGEHLVLVDMETLMHNETNSLDFQDATAQSVMNEQYRKNSVLRTGMLPSWEANAYNGVVYDISGLGCIDPQPLPWRVTRWKSINTDNMHQVFETATIPVGNNVPRLGDMPLSPNDYINELVQGFEQMYRFFVQHRLILLSEASPLAGLQAQQVRFIFRPTRVYSILLQKTLTPEFLQNGVDRSIELDILTRMLLTSRTKPIAWSILQAELQAMEQLDIPYFASYADSDALTVGVENSIQKYFQSTGYEQIIERLKHLSENDLVQQIAIIRGTFYARVAKSSKSSKSLGSELNKTVRPVTGLTSQKVNCLEIIPLTHNQLLADAQDIAEEIYSHAIQEADGATRWIGLNYIPKAERYQFQPLDESLYNGNCGIALFLAALDYVKGGNQFRNLALSSLQYTCRVLQTNHPDLMQQFAQKIGIGGATGLGSIIYSLVKTSRLLQEPALIEDARKFSNLITIELLATDQQFDVTYGAAGAILGLLALYNETGDAVVLEKAIACGQHLLKHQISVDGSPRAWKKLENKPLTGFSHGVAGIAYALLQLHAVTRDSIYLEAACEGIAYERSVFSTKAANWPDFRFLTQPNAQPSFEVSWCHGAPGIGLARLGGLSILQTEEICQDVEVALQNIQQHSLHTVDHICCGNFGRIEVLLAAAQKLSRPDLLEMAQQKAALVVARAKQTGGYQLFTNLPNHVFSPSFFQGTAGIGYELLRLAYPSKLPSVLLWE